jgi:hypothetical protein
MRPMILKRTTATIISCDDLIGFSFKKTIAIMHIRSMVMDAKKKCTDTSNVYSHAAGITDFLLLSIVVNRSKPIKRALYNL